MNEQLELIARRIKELRDILDISPEEMAEKLGIPVETYADYEELRADIPIGVLYNIASFMGVDATELLTGEQPRMQTYTVIRQGKGVSIERYKGYSFSALAFNYIGREMDPMIVTISPDEKRADLVTHPGQEFNYIIEGCIGVTIGNKEIILEAGDSIYFDPSLPHGQRAVGVESRFLTVINENMHR